MYVGLSGLSVLPPSFSPRIDMAGAPDEVLSERDRLAIIWFEEARLELVESFCEMLCALRCDDVHLALARAKRVSVACRARCAYVGNIVTNDAHLLLSGA